MKTLVVLGREKLLSFAELSAREPSARHYGQIATVRSDSLLDINSFGGSIKAAVVEAELPISAQLGEIESSVAEILKNKSAQSNSKFSFGVSAYDSKSFSPRRLQLLGIKLKKTLTSAGTSARYVQPKKGLTLTAAQLKFNKLTDNGCEIIIATTKSAIFVATTYAYQDIDSYSKRDWGRPIRDSKVGMLPPKLAQIMLNLSEAKPNQTIYDPFCGNGVILQEALLMQHPVSGSDIDPSMVKATQQNLEWLSQNYPIEHEFRVWEEDATKIAKLPKNCAVVTEGYLGKPLAYVQSDRELAEISQPVEKIYYDFLKKLRSLLEPGQKSVISFPVWQTKSGLKHMVVIDQISELGYTFKQCCDQNTLIYKRDNQMVGREIAVLIAK